MFRRILCSVVNEIVPNPLHQIQVRWRTKPRWLPVAKTKVFRIPEKKKCPLDEHDEITRLFNIYRTEMKSLREYLAGRTKAMSTGEEVLAENARREDEEYQEAVRINLEWNARIAERREKILAAEKEEETERILESVELAKAEAREVQRKAEEIVRLEKERAKHYITRENIDEAINKALENPVDLEFAIDRDENIIHGRNTRIVKNQSEAEQKIAASA